MGKRFRHGAGLIAGACLVAGLSHVAVAVVASEPINGPAAAYAPADRIAPPTPEPPPPGGNPGGVTLPSSATPADTSRPDIVIGNGNASACTSAAVVDAVARGGVITFDCGTDPVTIEMTATAKVVNTSQTVVIDGGGLVTLSGRDERRILYMNTCDRAQVWTTSHCQNQDHPQLTLQNLHFTRGNATGETIEGGGGGAVFVRGGQVKVINNTFTSNRCDPTGPDVGGGALRVLSQFDGRPVIVANSTFGGSAATGNVCSNGGATSSIGVSWQIYNSVFTHNHAIGNGANPQRAGTPGGGNGGAIYLDGGTMRLDLAGSIVTDNSANEGGGGVFYVSNNRDGTMHVTSSRLERNPSRGFNTDGFPSIFYLGRGPIQVTNSITN